MKLTMLLIICALFGPVKVFSQTQDPPKVELGVEFVSLTREDFGRNLTSAGFGGRVTYNLNKNFALEGAGYFFPGRCSGCENGGRVSEVVGGLKAGKRFERWGVFAKARPGIIHFSDGPFDIVGTGQGIFPFEFVRNSLTNFATDLGGVVEFYPSRRIVARFDAGDTLIHFRRRTANNFALDPNTGGIILVPFTTPAKTTHNFQFSAGVGFRF